MKQFDSFEELNKWINKLPPKPKNSIWETNNWTCEEIVSKLIDEGYDIDNLTADGHDYELCGHTNHGWLYRDEVDPEYIDQNSDPIELRDRNKEM